MVLLGGVMEFSHPVLLNFWFRRVNKDKNRRGYQFMLKIYYLKELFLLYEITKNQMALNHQYTVGVNWYALVYG